MDSVNRPSPSPLFPDKEKLQKRTDASLQYLRALGGGGVEGPRQPPLTKEASGSKLPQSLNRKPSQEQREVIASATPNMSFLTSVKKFFSRPASKEKVKQKEEQNKQMTQKFHGLDNLKRQASQSFQITKSEYATKKQLDDYTRDGANMDRAFGAGKPPQKKDRPPRPSAPPFSLPLL